MSLLLDDRVVLWAVSEVEREIGNETAVADSLARLFGAGLVHRVEDRFIKATRAAIHFRGLELS